MGITQKCQRNGSPTGLSLARDTVGEFTQYPMGDGRTTWDEGRQISGGRERGKGLIAGLIHHAAHACELGRSI